MLPLQYLSGTPQTPLAHRSSQSSSQPFLPAPACGLPTEVKHPTDSCQYGSTTMSSQPAATHRRCTSAEAAPQEVSSVAIPFLPQSTAFLKHYCRHCPTTAVRSGSTSTPAFSLPRQSRRDGGSAKARNDFPPLTHEHNAEERELRKRLPIPPSLSKKTH